ncbi:MAG: PA2779 family protein [Betaproteobacteria bacterium]
MRILTVLLLGLALAFPAAAGMIATPAEDESSRVKAMLERPEVQAELEKMGIAAAEAAARADAMSDAEVVSLAGRLDAVPAGGAVSDRELILILLIVILVMLLL